MTSDSVPPGQSKAILESFVQLQLFGDVEKVTTPQKKATKREQFSYFPGCSLSFL